MLRSDQVSLSLWKSGAYRAASFDPDAGRGALVEHDGRQAMRLVAVTDDGFEQTIATSRTVRGGLSVRVSTLRGYRDGSIEWRWQVVRPGLRRDETLRIDAKGRPSFRQTDRRPGRTTTFRSTESGSYQGETTTRSGELHSRSEWARDERGGLTGSFTGPKGEPTGEMKIPARAERASGEPVAWSTRDSKGSIAYGENDRPKSAVVETKDGVTTYTWDDGDGHSHQVGKSPDASWIKITVPGKGEGDTSWVEMGSQRGTGGSTSDYTINGVSKADGSTSFERIDNNPTTGDKEHTFGGKDAQGNVSYSSRVEHKDGSVTLVTRTVDKHGNGTEHTTVVDANGNVISDGTKPVKGGITQPGGSGRGPGLGIPGTSPATPVDQNDEDSDEPDDSEDSDDPDDSGDSDDSDDSDDDDSDDDDSDDSDDADDPDEPDSPDDGDDDGRDNPDGADDGRPGIPWGKIPPVGGDWGDGFAGLKKLVSGGGDDDEGRRPDVIGRLKGTLGREIIGIINGGGFGSGGGGADETGWGGGGESFEGKPLVAGSGTWRPGGADDSGWGDLNDPRMLVALIERFATASAALARSGTLTSALKR